MSPPTITNIIIAATNRLKQQNTTIKNNRSINFINKEAS
jgi:hypothetical protein